MLHGKRELWVPVIVQRPDPCFSTSSRTPPRAASLLDGGFDVVPATAPD